MVRYRFMSVAQSEDIRGWLAWTEGEVHREIAIFSRNSQDYQIGALAHSVHLRVGVTTLYYHSVACAD